MFYWHLQRMHDQKMSGAALSYHCKGGIWKCLLLPSSKELFEKIILKIWKYSICSKETTNLGLFPHPSSSRNIHFSNWENKNIEFIMGKESRAEDMKKQMQTFKRMTINRWYFEASEKWENEGKYYILLSIHPHMHLALIFLSFLERRMKKPFRKAFKI